MPVGLDLRHIVFCATTKPGEIFIRVNRRVNILIIKKEFSSPYLGYKTIKQPGLHGRLHNCAL